MISTLNLIAHYKSLFFIWVLMIFFCYGGIYLNFIRLIYKYIFKDSNGIIIHFYKFFIFLIIKKIGNYSVMPAMTSKLFGRSVGTVLYGIVHNGY